MTYQPEFPTTAAAADARIQSAQRAVIERIAAAPEKARSTIRTTGEIGEGLSCRVRQGKFEAVTDLSLGMGGDCTGPSPGFFARVGIVGCVGIAVKMLAAREEFQRRRGEDYVYESLVGDRDPPLDYRASVVPGGN